MVRRYTRNTHIDKHMSKRIKEINRRMYLYSKGRLGNSRRIYRHWVKTGEILNEI